MINGHMEFEDLSIDFTENDGRYFATLRDKVTGRKRELNVTHQEMGAIMHLLFGPPTGQLEELLYQVAEPLVMHLPPELSPIP